MDDKKPTKSVQVSFDVHAKMKAYLNKKGVKVTPFVDEAIKEKLKKETTKP